MTRINTNVSSLVGRNNLQRANEGLSQSLTRLSTGLRINTGADDPAGLIASENLRSDITAIRRAISNTDRANQVIATADSALGQVSSLLNDIRGLVTESANSGALSEAQISANQLQVDSSLEALNRIAQTTTFQGRRLLDGSLDFLTTAGTGFANIEELQIDQANLGATGSVSVDIDVATAATQAQVDVENIPATQAAVTASDGTLTFQTTAVQADGTATIVGEAVDFTALAGGSLAGAAGNGTLTITLTDNGLDDNSFTSATLTGTTLEITADFSADSTLQIGTLVTAVDGAVGSGGTGDLTVALDSGATATTVVASAASTTSTLANGVDAVDAAITISPTAAGASFNRTIAFVDGADLGAGASSVTDDGTTLTVNVDDDTAVDLSTLVTQIETALDANDDFTVTLTNTAGDGQYDASTDTAPVLVNVGATTAGVNEGGLTTDVVLELSGSNGSEVLSFGVNSTIDEIVAGINLVSDATGVSANANSQTLELTSTAYGSAAFVDISVIEDTASLFTDARSVGTDIVASVNGVAATGTGNDLTINTATLDLSATLTAGVTGTSSFTITGGGALFQLGPDVVSNQQARLGVGSVNTARLGSTSGKLFQLGTGGDFDLSTDATTAASIVEEAIDQVTSLRGRLGAFQRTTLETNKNALNDTLTNLTDAESSIRDADFAEETANLTRTQILVQSGTRVLAIANQNPQNVLALLG